MPPAQPVPQCAAALVRVLRPCYTVIMHTYHDSLLSPGDRRAQQALDALLAKAGLVRDTRPDETVGIYDEDYRLIASGMIRDNTLRCIAVDPDRQGEGLMATLMTALLERQAARGHRHVFLYTKPESAPQFREVGFHEIAHVPGLLTFMENRRGAFGMFLGALSAVEPRDGVIASVVMNANPFTRGHQHLLEHAAAENDRVRCFVVSEDISLVPFADRITLVRSGTAHLPNVTVHPSGNYIISSATFPAYFLKEERVVTQTQARLDIAVFARIAAAMGITRRYIGEEPFSEITGLYNGVMQSELPAHGIECVLIPRREDGGVAISASNVRQLIHDGRMDAIRPLVPESTWAYFDTEAGRETIQRIRAAERVRHD